MNEEIMEKPVSELREEGKLSEAIAQVTKEIQQQIGETA